MATQPRASTRHCPYNTKDMKGSVTIDGIDVADFGATLLRGSDGQLISFPTRKDANIIEWPDADGFEIGSDAPTYEARTISLQWFCKSVATDIKQHLNDFIALHKPNRYINMYVRELDTTFKLRYQGITAHDQSRGGFSSKLAKWVKLTIDYVMDEPTQYVDVLEPISLIPMNTTKVKLDTLDLGSYGIIVEDVYSTALRSEMKIGVEHTSAYTTGKIISFIGKKAKQNIDITCTMLGYDKEDILGKYKALWTAINKPSVSIKLTEAGRQYTAYYNSMRSASKVPFSRDARFRFVLEFSGYEV